MPRKSPHQDLALNPPRAGQPLFRWIYEELRAAVLDGRLAAGARVPSTRNLAEQYGLARGTVLAAFEQLQAEGYLEGRTGAGSYVSRQLPERTFRSAASPRRPTTAARRLPALSQLSRELVSPFPLAGEDAVGLAFQPNQPALDLFPLKVWSQIVSRRARLAPRQLLGSGDAQGYRPLREAIAAYLGPARGVHCTADQIVIVSGSQQAMDLAVRLTLEPGDEAWVEDPGYSGVLAALRGARAKVVAVPVDDHGLDVATGRLRAPRARFAYITPAHQFPLGASLSLERRLALLKWADEAGAWIFEDDYDSEYRFHGRPLPALQGISPGSPVIFAASFNKLLFPALRLGYLVLPPPLIEPVCRLRSVIDRFPPVLDQAALCDFMTEGHFGQHLRRMREAYAERLEVLIRAAPSLARHGLLLRPIHAGMQIPAFLPLHVNDQDFVADLARQGIHAIPLSPFQIERQDVNGLLLGFSGIKPSEIARGIKVLKSSLRERQRTQI